jgi:hypothetical protein
LKAKNTCSTSGKLPVFSPVDGLTAIAVPTILNLLAVYRILETANGTATADDLEHTRGNFTLKSLPASWYISWYLSLLL